MEVILLERIERLWQMVYVVNVKDGYARNYLFPNQMALRIKKENLSHYENIKDKMLEKETEKLKNIGLGKTKIEIDPKMDISPSAGGDPKTANSQ